MHYNIHSAYSLRYGTLTIDKLLAMAVDKGHVCIGLTDINNTSGALEFVAKARKAGIKPIVGIEFRSGGKLDYIGLAQNERGFQELNQFLSHHLHAAALDLGDASPPDEWPLGEDAERLPEGPGSALPGNLRRLNFPEVAPPLPDTVFIYPFESCPPVELLAANTYVGIRPIELNKLFSSELRHHPEKLVSLLPVTFADKVGYNLHRLLRAIDLNILLSKQKGHEIAAADEFMYSPDAFAQFYKEHPHILANTLHVMASCSFGMDLDSPKNKRHFTNSESGDLVLLRKLAKDGFARRYGGDHAQPAKKRLEEELAVIAEMGFCAYFLITLDFVNYAKARGFFHVGRGSGANSLVAYCLGITDVDPIELNLFFERFLNVHRTSPPDFDMDFSWRDRDEVIDYVFKRHGHAHVAFVATHVCWHGRSIIRELGKVFGLSKAEIDKMIQNRHAPELDDKVVRAIYRYAPELEGLPNYLGMHPGGMLISEKPIHCYSATSVPPKGFPVVHFEMVGAEAVGLYKFDVLSQRGLADIRSTLELLQENRGIHVDIYDMKRFFSDPKISVMLATGNTLGVFYVGSPAMRQLLRKMECDNYISLVAASSVIRPGVAKSGMMRQYIERYRHSTGKPPNEGNGYRKTPVNMNWYLDASMREYLGETFGVMVFQEDVLKVAHNYAGIGLGEADVLRRAMSGKDRSNSRFKSLMENFFKGAARIGRDPIVTAEVWRQMESFAGYSFCKSHSASYAVESYQALFLKAYFPLEFLTSIINNFGGYYRTEVYAFEIQRSGGTVQAPCVNRSRHLATISGTEVFLGFVHMKMLRKEVSTAILAARGACPFAGLTDFLARVPSIGLEQATLLVRVGAFRFTGKSKKNLLWEVGMHFGKAVAARQSTVLFQIEEPKWEIPELVDSMISDAYDEIEILGFPLVSPFAMTEGVTMKGEILGTDLKANHGKRVVITGYLLSTKSVLTSKNEMMGYADFIDQRGNLFDVTLFPNVYEQNATPHLGVYRISGTVISDFGVHSIEVVHIERLGYKPDPRYH